MKSLEIELTKEVKCPNRTDGKNCHYHTFFLRNYIHKLHCFAIGCYHSQLYQFYLKITEPEKYRR